VLPPALAAITRAAELLYHSELWQQHGSSVELSAVEQADLAVAAALRDGASVTDEQLGDARGVAAQMQVGCMKVVTSCWQTLCRTLPAGAFFSQGVFVADSCRLSLVVAVAG